MKFFWLFIFGLFFAQGCAAQEKSQLLPQMPDNVSISFARNGGMSRSYRRTKIENDKLEFEELTGNQSPPRKWSPLVSREDLAGLYRVFVENKFDTIKNDERQGIVYDAGSENISISVGADKYFHTTYGKNSPLSGKNLQRYQAVRKALNDFIARHQNEKKENLPDENQAVIKVEKCIQGNWRAEGKNGRNSWYLEWTFTNGNFMQKGYPPIFQEGKYKIIDVQGDKITLELNEQKGTFGEGKRTIEIITDNEKQSLTISGTRGFSPRSH